MTHPEPNSRIVGRYMLPGMGDATNAGGIVVVDDARATTDRGYRCSPVTSHTCPSCGGELWWDDGVELEAPQGAVCECGTTVATASAPGDTLRALLERVDRDIAAIPESERAVMSHDLREHATEMAVEQVDKLTDADLNELSADPFMPSQVDEAVTHFVEGTIGKDQPPHLQRAIAKVCDLVYALVLRGTYSAAVTDPNVDVALTFLRHEFRRVGGFHPDDDASTLRNMRGLNEGVEWNEMPLTFTAQEAVRVNAAIDTLRSAGIDPSEATLPIAHAEGWL